MRSYELSDHLGNVHVVLSDLKKADNGILKSQTLAAYEYYPFGMMMQKFESSSGYRYGFNGMEKDEEIKGGSNSYDFGARIYDPRLGRWLSLDPMMDKYPSWSPYNFAANNPIKYYDVDGEDIVDGIKLLENLELLSDANRLLNEHAKNIEIYATTIDKLTEDLEELEAKKAIAERFTRGPLGGLDYLNDALMEKLYADIEMLQEHLQKEIQMHSELSALTGQLAEIIDANLTNPDGIALPDPETGQIGLYNLISVTNEADVKNGIHKNNNKYSGPQSVYEIKINGKIYKYGKADMKSLTKNGDPKRLDSQLKSLQKKHPRSKVQGRVIEKYKNISTEKIKQRETKRILDYKSKYGKGKYIPYGNKGHRKYGKPKK